MSAAELDQVPWVVFCAVSGASVRRNRAGPRQAGDERRTERVELHTVPARRA